jgi:hypothetical protein
MNPEYGANNVSKDLGLFLVIYTSYTHGFGNYYLNILPEVTAKAQKST